MNFHPKGQPREITDTSADQSQGSHLGDGAHVVYRGWVYSLERDFEDDNVKNFHYLTRPDGSRVKGLPWGSYDFATQRSLIQFIWEQEKKQ